MSHDSIYLGESPYGEDCAQLGQDNYTHQARKECNALINQLKRMFGELPVGANLYIKSNPHDFGNYLSVECSYDDNIDESVEYAFKCEESYPEFWDEEAKKELNLQ